LDEIDQMTAHYQNNKKMSNHILSQLGNMFGRSLATPEEAASINNKKEVREDLRPKEEIITGDLRLPEYYNIR